MTPLLKFTIPSITCDGAAFEDGQAPAELARILRAIADDIEGNPDYDKYRNAHDVNGNVVGTYRLARKD